MSTELVKKGHVPVLNAEGKVPEPEELKAPIRVAILLPVADTFEAGMAYDLMTMLYRCGATVCADGMMSIHLFMLPGTLIHTSRNELVKKVLRDTDCTHVLFLDSDMRFEWQLLPKLLAANKDIVGVNYPTRRERVPHPTAFVDLTIAKPGEEGMPERFLQPTPEPGEGDKLVKVAALGMGACLIRTEVFAAIRYPWFENVYDHVNRQWVGEDVDFCRKATDAGIDIWCDTHLSEGVAHVGRFSYTLNHVRAANEAREAMKQEQGPQLIKLEE